MLAEAHQRQFDLVLDVFDVDRAAFGLAAHQRIDHLFGQLGHLVADAGGGGTLLANHGQEGLGHRDGDFDRLERHYRAIAANGLVQAEIGLRRGGAAEFCGGLPFKGGQLHVSLDKEKFRPGRAAFLRAGRLVDNFVEKLCAVCG